MSFSELFARLVAFVSGGPRVADQDPRPPLAPGFAVTPMLDPEVLARADADALPDAVLTQLHFEPSLPHVVADQGVLMQTAMFDVLLDDGRASRMLAYAYYDARTFEPLRLAYVPIHELAGAQEVGA